MDGTAAVSLGASEPAQAEDLLRVDFDIAGSGQIDIPAALQVRFTVAARGLPAAVDVEGRRGEVIRIADAIYSRDDHGGWTRKPADSLGILAATVLSPDLPALLRSATGDVDDLGTADIEGIATRHLAFDVADAGMDQGPGWDLDYRAHVWIDDNDRLRQVRLDAQGTGSQPLPGYWQIGVRMTLSDIGTGIDIRPPPLPSPDASPGGA
ncbi:MAG: hypothetical protein M3425_11535 [Actinomycetota bacterium]|nr:hypothetical protein [Actinomycetota bacterium]